MRGGADDEHDDGSGGGSPPTDTDTDTDTGPAPRRRLAAEALLALELLGLASFAFSRTVLDAFGRSPESFVARGATGADVVAFGLLVAFGPALVVIAPGPLALPFGQGTRRWVHIVLVGLVGAVAAWQLAQAITGWAPESERLVAVALLLGVGLGVARLRWAGTRTFLRWTGAASVIFAAQFLVFSPAADLAFGGEGHLGDEAAAAVDDQMVDDPPDVLFLVFDALPTASLMDGQGHIDAELFPNFAALAGDGTWYRNNTSVAAFTRQAVPALLTGRMPETLRTSDHGRDRNLFTLLRDRYDLHVRERVTRLCPSDVCAPAGRGHLGDLLGDAADMWSRGVAAGGGETDFELPGIQYGHDYRDAAAWLDAQQLDAGGRPDLVFQHVVLPHEPWTTGPDGRRYRASTPPTGYFVNAWTDRGVDVGHQRHVLQLQAADRLLGQHLDRLRAAGMYDDAVVVVTADHGAAFLPGAPSRALAAENYADIMWTPLLVKGPDQGAGAVDDRDVRATDVLPLIAGELGVEVPWAIDGATLADAAGRDGRTKPFDDERLNELRADDGESEVDVPVGDALARVLAADAVPGTGPDAPWRRTSHGALFGRPVAQLTVVDARADGPVPRGGDAGVEVDHLDDIRSSTADQPYAEVVGWSELPADATVAYALNGTVGAVTDVDDVEGGADLVHGLLPVDLFRDGGNELTAYLVTGPPGAETLRPLAVQAAG